EEGAHLVGRETSAEVLGKGVQVLFYNNDRTILWRHAPRLAPYPAVDWVADSLFWRVNPVIMNLKCLRTVEHLPLAGCVAKPLDQNLRRILYDTDTINDEGQAPHRSGCL